MFSTHLGRSCANITLEISQTCQSSLPIIIRVSRAAPRSLLPTRPIFQEDTQPGRLPSIDTNTTTPRSDMTPSSVARFSKNTHSQEHCRLLQLPFELRAIIFELAYTTDTNEDGTIDLHDTDPPRRNLVLACQAAYRESWALYKKAFQAYWRQEFTIMIPGSLPIGTWWYCNACTRDLAHITKLRLVCVTTASSTPAVFVVHMRMEGSAWTARLVPQQDLSMYGTRVERELTDFYRFRCNRWLAYLGEERETGLTLSLLPALLWAASRPLLFF